MKNAKQQMPKFNTSDFFKVVFKRLDYVENRVPDDISENLRKILNEVQKNNKVSIAEMAKAIGISKRKILDNINKLKEMGLLERIGDNKTGHWKLKITNALN